MKKAWTKTMFWWHGVYHTKHGPGEAKELSQDIKKKTTV